MRRSLVAVPIVLALLLLPTAPAQATGRYPDRELGLTLPFQTYPDGSTAYLSLRVRPHDDSYTTYQWTTPDGGEGGISFDGGQYDDAYSQHRLEKARFRLEREFCIDIDVCQLLHMRVRWIGYGPRTVTTGPSYGSVTRSAHILGHITIDGVRYPGWDLSVGTGTLMIYYG